MNNQDISTKIFIPAAVYISKTIKPDYGVYLLNSKGDLEEYSMNSKFDYLANDFTKKLVEDGLDKNFVIDTKVANGKIIYRKKRGFEFLLQYRLENLSYFKREEFLKDIPLNIKKWELLKEKGSVIDIEKLSNSLCIKKDYNDSAVVIDIHKIHQDILNK
jgi:hypothetical protein